MRSDPIVVGGTGGSGTRAVHQLLTAAGAFMGERLHTSLDALDFEPFLDKHINTILNHTHSLSYALGDLPAAFAQEAVEELRGIVEQYAADVPASTQIWGWKNPRAVFVLPFIKAVCPQMKLLHVLRDGRDMALSKNQWQVYRHYAALFETPEPELTAAGSMRMWNRVNTDTLAWANTGAHYTVLRYEDVCARNVPVINAALLRLSLTFDVSQLAVIDGEAKIGRYRELPAAKLQRLMELGAEGLKQFGYV